MEDKKAKGVNDRNFFSEKISMIFEAIKNICRRFKVYFPKKRQACAPKKLDWLVIILTNKCNLKCSYCLRNADSGGQEIDFEILKNIIFSANSVGCRNCTLTGGETLLYSKFKKLMNLLSSLGWFVHLETNGKILTHEICAFLEKKLRNNFTIFVSLDSRFKEIHDSLRGEGSFDSAILAIKTAKVHGINLETIAVLTPKNMMGLKELTDFVVFNKELGVNRVHLERVVPSGRGINERLLLSQSQIKEFSETLKEYGDAEEYLSRGAFPRFFGALADKNECKRLSRQLCVSPNGIHPCVFQEKIKIGELEGFKDIISNKELFDELILSQKAIANYYHDRNDSFSCAECVKSLSFANKQKE